MNTLTSLKKFSSLDLLDNTSPYHKYLDQNERKTSKNLKNDWKYYINDYGFRGKWDLNPELKIMGFFGCSFTFGVGLSEEETFSGIISSKLDNVSCINLGSGGASIPRIAKILYHSTKLINFDTVIITLPSMLRLLVVDEYNRYIDLLPNYKAPSHRKIQKCAYEFFSENYFKSQGTDYICWMQLELKLKGIKSLWCSWDQPTHNIIEQVVPKEQILNKFEVIPNDIARDNLHPGKLSNEKYADKIIKKLNDLRWY